MSIFGDIWNKVTGGSTATAAPAATDPAAPPPDPNDFSPEPTDTPTASGAAMMSEVDVEQILNGLAAQKGDFASNWGTSIVDLLKVLDLDSSLAARKELADELNVREGADGSAEQNTALHRAVMHKLEENGGKVPDSLKS